MSPYKFQELCTNISGYDAIVVMVTPKLYRRYCNTSRCVTTGSSNPLTGIYGTSDTDYKAVGNAKILRLTEEELLNYRSKRLKLHKRIKDFL